MPHIKYYNNIYTMYIKYVIYHVKISIYFILTNKDLLSK